jgi:hypothetical protein
MRAREIAVFGVLTGLALALSGCASAKPNPASGSQAGKGFRVLEAVVVERVYAPPGSPGTKIDGSGAYYLELEAQDGGATAHYRFEVTRIQYTRYVEGTHVQLVMADHQLREIRARP